MREAEPLPDADETGLLQLSVRVLLRKLERRRVARRDRVVARQVTQSVAEDGGDVLVVAECVVVDDDGVAAVLEDGFDGVVNDIVVDVG